MKLKITRREGEFSPHINGRTEGSGTGKKPAADLKVEFLGTKRDIATLVPLVTSEKFTDLMYDENGQFKAPYMNPLRIHRHPDGLRIRIYDQGKRNPLTFSKASSQKIEVEFYQKHQVRVTMQLQIRPEKSQGDRLFSLITLGKAEFEIEAEQDELGLFDDEEAEGEDGDQGGDEAQQELPNDASLAEDDAEDEPEDD